MKSMFDFIKNEIQLFKDRMYMLGLNKWHLFSIMSLEIIGWTLIFIFGYKAYNCC